jgi:hypothetical protein
MSALPAAECKGLTFFPVPVFDGPSQAFGADERAYFHRRDLPEVPSKFKDIANDLFFSGGKIPDLDPRISAKSATHAIRAWLASWAPSHESKETTVGYALWLWTTPEAIDAAIKAMEAEQACERS